LSIPCVFIFDAIASAIGRLKQYTAAVLRFILFSLLGLFSPRKPLRRMFDDGSACCCRLASTEPRRRTDSSTMDVLSRYFGVSITYRCESGDDTTEFNLQLGAATSPLTVSAPRHLASRTSFHLTFNAADSCTVLVFYGLKANVYHSRPSQRRGTPQAPPSRVG
jgi:hypothetical protein